jgi:hypothetical protein
MIMYYLTSTMQHFSEEICGKVGAASGQGDSVERAGQTIWGRKYALYAM